MTGVARGSRPLPAMERHGGRDAQSAQVQSVDPAHVPLLQVQGLSFSYPGFDAVMLERLLPRLSLAEHRLKPMYMLSTGSRRKVWLAAAFASGAALTMLDQPFAALDKASVGVILDLLQEAARNPTRTWILADYEPPHGLAPVRTIELG